MHLAASLPCRERWPLPARLRAARLRPSRELWYKMLQEGDAVSTPVRAAIVSGAVGLLVVTAFAASRPTGALLILWPLCLGSVALMCWATGWAGGLAAAIAAPLVAGLADTGFRPSALQEEWAFVAAVMAGCVVAACAICLALGAARRWQRLHDSAVEALVTAIDGRYEWSRGRSVRVADYAAAIGRRLGVRGRRARHLRLAALLRDVGTLMVSPEVLTKKGVLSGPQRMDVEAHPGAGANILSPIGYHPDVLDAVRSHHERADGTGYPSGLVAGQTPLLAKIVAVADAFEALTHDRPYRPALPPSEAVALLRGGAYSPQVVDALAQALERAEMVVARPARPSGPRWGPSGSQRGGDAMR